MDLWGPLTGAHGFFSRLHGSPFLSETQRTEHILARARVVLAVGSLLTVYLAPAEAGPVPAVANLGLCVYVLYSLLLLRFWRDPTPRFIAVAHGVDVLWPLIITSFAPGVISLFFVPFSFALLAAAFRWSFRETLATAGTTVFLQLAQALVSTADPAQFEALSAGEFGLRRVVTRVVYLLTMGTVLGYLGDQEKRMRAEASAMARLLATLQRAQGLRDALSTLFADALRIFGSPQALLAVRETNRGPVHLLEARPATPGQGAKVFFSELDASRGSTYFFATRADSWHVVRRARWTSGGRFSFIGLDEHDRRVRDRSFAVPDGFVSSHAFRSLLAVSFTFGEEGSGRLFLVDPKIGFRGEAELRFLRAAVRQLIPLLYSIHLLSRLRSQAHAVERARAARELHDGAIQSLIAAEMHLEVLRRQAAGSVTAVSGELARVQDLLHQEVLKLRVLMQQISPLEIAPTQLPGFLTEAVERFERETGIRSRFLWDAREIALPRQVCSELARTVQEALVNVRKHSGARSVLVRLCADERRWKLVIEDDGRGFPFSGRFTQAELEAGHKGPRVIRERVRSIGGALIIESVPGHGARLEVTLPYTAHE